MVHGVVNETLARLSARLDAQEAELVELHATLAGMRAKEQSAPPIIEHVAPSAESGVSVPASRRTSSASRRTLLKGAGAALFTTALLATGEVLPITPYQVAAAGPAPRPSGPSGPALATAADTLYQTFVGTDFQPETTSKGEIGFYAGASYGSGPIYPATAGTQAFSARLNLPQGATIVEAIFYVVHSDAAAMSVDIAGYDPNDVIVSNIGSASVTATSGSVQVITVPITAANATADNAQHSYVLEWIPSTGSTAHQLYGARVGYTLPGRAQVYGHAQAGAGVRGDSDSGNGVVGITVGSPGTLVGNVAGVLGSTNASLLSDQGAGVAGMSDVASIPAVYGRATHGDTHGVQGVGAGGGSGVHGLGAGGGPGVWGANGSAAGVGVVGINYPPATGGVGVLGQGDTASGVGVKGTSINGTGVAGQATDAANGNAGVLGLATRGPGVQGQSTSGYGLVGFTNAQDGHAGLIGYANTAGGIGLIGNAPGGASPGLAGVFNGDVTINGALRVYGSPKNAAVKHPTDGSYRLLYCMESPESWFEDFGRAKLVNGAADIGLDPDFAALVHADDYHVFLMPRGDSRGLYVADQTAAGFTVREQQGGTSNLAFSYRVVAKRRDIAGERLARVAPPPPMKPVAPFAVPETPEPKPPATKP